jgi:adenine-specific DNA-methyltransferase
LEVPHLPVREGELVAAKRQPGNQLWRVKSVRKDIAICEKEVEAFPPPREPGKEFPIAELVVVRNFGDPIYPALMPVDRAWGSG